MTNDDFDQLQIALLPCLRATDIAPAVMII